MTSQSSLLRRQSVFVGLVTLAHLIAVEPGFAADRAKSKDDDVTQAPPLTISNDVRDRCLSILRDGFASDEFWPSMHAAEALTLAGHGPDVKDALAAKLETESDDQKRCGLARELVRAGDITRVGVMLDILVGENPHGHVHAAESLYKVAEVGDGRAMRRALAHAEKPAFKLMAAAALARCGNPDALSLIRESLAKDEIENARIAAWILARIGDASDIPALHAFLKRAADPLSRCYGEGALAALGDRAGLEATLANMASSEPDVRTYAADFASECAAHAADVPLQASLEKLLDDDKLDARIRAAQALLVLSQTAPPPRDADVAVTTYPATAENPRYSEGSVVRLRDGSLLYATTEFIDSDSDFAKARIIARASTDGGRAWSDSRVLQENVGKTNVMSVTLRRLDATQRETAPLGMFYLIKNTFDDLDAMLRVSHDEGQTFDEPILVTADPGYHVLNNDRVTVLSSGRILVPVASTADVEKENHFVSSCYLSDDGGATWRRSQGRVDFTARGAMEPEVIELDDNHVLMLIRTQAGVIAAARSADGGDTWSEAASWGVRAPESPATLRRVPATGDLLLVWNNTFEEGAGHGGKRTPLTAAISKDGGQSWQHARDLESRADESYAYTSLIFVKDRAVLSYYVGEDNTGRISSRFRSLPVGWFYAAK